jgi:glutathione S-transferase
MGRHSAAEIGMLGARSIDAVAEHLGEKPYFMGAEPTGVDASLFAFAAGVLCPRFETPLRSAAERHANLKQYVGRMTGRYYPEMGEIAGCKAENGGQGTQDAGQPG